MPQAARAESQIFRGPRITRPRFLAWRRQGQPIDVNREVAFELVGEILRQVGVGALVVDVGRDGSWFGHAGLLSWYLPLGYNASSFWRSRITEAPDGERPPDRDQ